MIPYWAVVAVISLVFIVLERLLPRRQQKMTRPYFRSDVVFLVFNGYFLAIILARAFGTLTPRVNALLKSAIGHDQISHWPLWGQFLLAFFVVDLMQWGIHVLMHRVPVLWHFHQVHHSIEDMDWLGSMRFHWFEIVVFRTLLYAPLFWLGFHGSVLVALAAFSTFMGHYNHANVRIGLGPMRYIFNNPDMHMWHHDTHKQGKKTCNYGINLSLWDWLFGTAFEPEEKRQPDNLGFGGLANFPRGFLAQECLPFGRRNRDRPKDNEASLS